MLATILYLCGIMGMQAQTEEQKPTGSYFPTSELPNACVYLPAPIDVKEAAFTDDFNQFLWGKRMRNTERGKQASWESYYGTARMATVFGEAMQMTISKKATPAIWHFIQRTGSTGNNSTNKAKRKYMRIRPFARMNEHVAGEFDDEEDLRHNGSYPSGHTGFGWSTALALAEMAPEWQDTILRRGFEYGQSRVIVGAHWQSDVDAGYLTASAAIARMHTSPEYWEDLAEARAEYRSIKGIAEDQPVLVGYPKVEKVLDPPVDSMSHRFPGDVVRYWVATAERKTERGQQAVQDTACSDSAFLRMFSSCVGMTLDAKNTPAIAKLVSMTFNELCTVASESKSKGFRKRPFVQYAESTPIPKQEGSHIRSSSYPSSHALLGWGVALALVEVMPNYQNALLLRGFEYGRSRIIVGFHYASDVQAGRLIAAGALARLHNNAEFLNLMDEAKKEYEEVKKK